MNVVIIFFRTSILLMSRSAVLGEDVMETPLPLPLRPVTITLRYTIIGRGYEATWLSLISDPQILILSL